MQEDDLRESSNVEDRRGVSGVGAGGLGIGAIVVLTLTGWATGIAAGRAVVPDSFTHGSAEQRVHWLTTGFKDGTIASCNTFE